MAGNGRVGNRSLRTVNVNWAWSEMTTSCVTGQSDRACVCARRDVYGQEMEGESGKQCERRGRDGNIGKQSFNGAEKNENGEKGREGGRRGLRKRFVPSKKTRRGEDGKMERQRVWIVWRSVSPPFKVPRGD